LAHANAAVVLSTVKVLMKLINLLPENSDFVNQLNKKLAPPMVTLLSAEPEIQYVALRNINLIVQKRYAANANLSNSIMLSGQIY
jgi:vesicle coat complex subunit